MGDGISSISSYTSTGVGGNSGGEQKFLGYFVPCVFVFDTI